MSIQKSIIMSCDWCGATEISSHKKVMSQRTIDKFIKRCEDWGWQIVVTPKRCYHFCDNECYNNWKKDNE